MLFFSLLLLLFCPFSLDWFRLEPLGEGDEQVEEFEFRNERNT